MSKNLHKVLWLLKSRTSVLEFKLQDFFLEVKNVDDNGFEDVIGMLDELDPLEYSIESKDVVLIELPQKHAILIMKWLIGNATIQVYNRFRHPDDKWEDVDRNLPYWDTFGKYRTKQ